MGKQALLERLQRDASPGGTDVETQLARDRDAWLVALRALMQQIRAWLSDKQLSESLQIRDDRVQILEEDLGEYTAPGLTIQSRTRHPRKVHVLPRAMQVVGGIFSGEHGERRLLGAHGRVDLVAGAARETLLRFERDDGTVWRWAHRDGELTEDSFFEALDELLT